MRLLQKRAAQTRSLAVRRGLEFIYRVARSPRHFADHGSDLLSCFHFVSATSLDPELRRRAREMGRERALRWRRLHPSLPKDADAGIIAAFVHGSDAADGLGVRDPALKRQLRRAARATPPADFLWYDPTAGPPPPDVPDRCACGIWNERGRKTCCECRRRLKWMTRPRVWYYTLMLAYTGERYGVPLGASYADVLRWLPSLRPYRGSEGGANEDFYDTVYAVTHVVYTLNDYNVYRLRPGWLPREFAFLKSSLAEALGSDDPEMVGEIMDSLRAFGLGTGDALIRRGVDYLLPRQNADGSWGVEDSEDIYHRYHTTWTALDGLREYRWRGEGLSFPGLMPLVRRLALTK